MGEEEEEEAQSKPLPEATGLSIQRQVEEEEEEIQAKLLSGNPVPLLRQVDEDKEEAAQMEGIFGQTQDGAPSPELRISNLRGGGRPLPKSVRSYFEPRFGRDFSGVSLRTDTNTAESAKAINARAFTVGQTISFGSGQYSPEAEGGKQLLAHELTHVVQQQQAPDAHSSLRETKGIHTQSADALASDVVYGGNALAPYGQMGFFSPVIQRADVIPVEIISSRHEYRPSGANKTFRVGDNHGPNILMKIEDRSEKGVRFHWYNFHNSIPISGSWREWDYLELAEPFIGETSRRFAALARQLTASQWERLWPDPVPELMKMYEAGTIRMGDEVVKEAYRGTVAKEARRTLDENEAEIDKLLNDPNRVQLFEEYAAGLKEASIVRDALVRNKSEIDRRLALSQQQFHLGLPKRQLMAGPSGYQRMRAIKEQAEYQATMEFWSDAFPLLTRLRTDEINAGSVLSTLTGIKAIIISTRGNLVGQSGRRPTLDPWELEGVRGRLEYILGAKTRQIVQEEDKSRRRWAWIKAGALFAGGIALLFLPGGIFIDAAVGIAIAAQSWQEAKVIGHAARADLHVDKGLMTQAQAQGARLSAILATIFAALGAAASGLRILRSTRAFLRISRTMPRVSVGTRMQLARLFAKEPEVLERLAARVAEEEGTLNRIHEAFRLFGDDAFRLRQAWKAISEGFTGDLHRAWMRGLHPDSLAALGRATSEELESIYRLMRKNPEGITDILRQFTYKARKEAREAGRELMPPQDVGRRLTESLQNLAAARKRGYPFGFESLYQFRRFGLTLRDALRRYGVRADDVRVHGSALHKLRPDDIDVAVLVDRAEFDRLANQFIDVAKYGGKTDLAETIAGEAAKGKIPYNRFAPRESGFEFGRIVRGAAGGKKVQVSLIPKGGEFDVGPYMGL
jgi:hypothetical protein